MAVAKSVRIMISVVALDDESTTFAFDLATDPFWIGAMSSSGFGGTLMNWTPTAVTDVRVVVGATKADMAGAGSTVVNVEMPAMAAGDDHDVVLDVFFA